MKLMTEPSALDDRTVLLSVLDLAEELRRQLPSERPVVDSEEVARAVVETLLGTDGASALTALDRDPDAAIQTARRMLELTLADDLTRSATVAVLDDPPSDDQMGAEVFVAVPAVLTLMVTWLQMHVDFKFSRRDGKTEVEFQLGKDAAGEATISKLIDVTKNVLGSQP
jgi:hypothetical protein